MGIKVCCTFCGDEEVVGELKWDGSTIIGRGRNVRKTAMCPSCMEAAQFTKLCIDDGSFISLDEYSIEGE